MAVVCFILAAYGLVSASSSLSAGRLCWTNENDFSSHKATLELYLEIFWLLFLSWWLADVYSHIAYGEPLGCVAQRQDVNGLIDAIQSAYPMVGTVAVLPWLFIPLIKNTALKKLVVPYLRASKGIKKLTDVRASGTISIQARVLNCWSSSEPREQDRQAVNWTPSQAPALPLRQVDSLISDSHLPPILTSTSAS